MTPDSCWDDVSFIPYNYIPITRRKSCREYRYWKILDVKRRIKLTDPHKLMSQIRDGQKKIVGWAIWKIVKHLAELAGRVADWKIINGGSRRPGPNSKEQSLPITTYFSRSGEEDFHMKIPLLVLYQSWIFNFRGVVVWPSLVKTDSFHSLSFKIPMVNRVGWVIRNHISRKWFIFSVWYNSYLWLKVSWDNLSDELIWVFKILSSFLITNVKKKMYLNVWFHY